MRIVYAGSPDIAVVPLRSLIEAGHEVVAVISQPARPVGRKKVLTDTPVTVASRELGLPVYTPSTAEDLHHALHETQPDLAVAVAYGRLITGDNLALPTHGWWNIHFSLLPQWRGATPVQHSILHGDPNSGVTIFRMDEGLDTGPIIATAPYTPLLIDTAGEQLQKMTVLGASLLIETLENFATLKETAQVGTPSFAPKFTRTDGQIDWTNSADVIDRRVRALTPEPGTYGYLRSGKQLGIVRAYPYLGSCAYSPGEVGVIEKKVVVGTGNGGLVLERVKPAGKSEMAASDWLRGAGSDSSFASD